MPNGRLCARRAANYAGALRAHGITPFSAGGAPPEPRTRTKSGGITVHRDQCVICAYSGPRPLGGSFRPPFTGHVVPDTPRRSREDRAASACANLCLKCWKIDKAVRETADVAWARLEGRRAPAGPSRAARASEIDQLEAATPIASSHATC